MKININCIKLVVRDLEASERFYRAMGFKVVSRNVGGEEEVRQAQCWLSETGDRSGFVLILSHFLETPPAPPLQYPNEVWLVFMTTDVDATVSAVRKEGGSVLRAGQDRPEHGVRAAVVKDPEGHIIEVVGPMVGASNVDGQHSHS
jgi:catechol 2,3-dioxygenase-like lactoylglutathione lyase family enzyme